LSWRSVCVVGIHTEHTAAGTTLWKKKKKKSRCLCDLKLESTEVKEGREPGKEAMKNERR